MTAPNRHRHKGEQLNVRLSPAGSALVASLAPRYPSKVAMVEAGLAALAGAAKDDAATLREIAARLDQAATKPAPRPAPAPAIAAPAPPPAPPAEPAPTRAAPTRATAPPIEQVGLSIAERRRLKRQSEQS